MKRSVYTNYDELPLFLNAEMVAKVLGISISSAYELMHETSFPALRVGSRRVQGFLAAFCRPEMPPEHWTALLDSELAEQLGIH